MNIDNKGEYLGKCNLSRCTTGKKADWYNHGSLKYYCEDCADMLSSDPVNKADAMYNFGHDLCTKDKHKTLNEILEEDKSYKFTNPYKDYLDNPNVKLAYNDIQEFSQKNSYTFIHETKPQQNNDLCSCDSGLKYKKCCKNK